MMVGGYFIYLVMVVAGMPIWLAIPISIISCAVIGMFIEKVAYRRLLKHNAARISLLITALGVSIFLQNLFMLLFGTDPKSLPTLFSSAKVTFGDLSLSWPTVLNIIVSVGMMISLQILVNKTKIGKAMQATSEDTGAAKLMGINTNWIIAFTFAIGSALAAVGALLYCNTYPRLSTDMGNLWGLKAFVAAVLGGIGSIPGAMLGGYLLGVAESLTKAYISTEYTDAVVFAILILVLSIKPTGLMGKSGKEKV
jgi:branched-chain amino acid transport system permease protein